MSEATNHGRRRFLGAAVMTIAGAELIRMAHRIIKGGVGHNLPQEAPQAFAEAVVDVDGY